MMGVRKSDHPERRKLAIIRKADTEVGATHNIGGVRKKEQRPKPSLPKMPWDAASPSDIGGLSERLNDAEGVGACLSGDPQFIKALCKEAATALDSLSARVKELEAECFRLASGQ